MKLYNLKRNFIIWTIVTIICATPSFHIAYDMKHNIYAMLLAIVIIIIGYTAASSSAFFQNIKANKIILSRSLKIGFILKIILSILAIVFQSTKIGFFIMLPDIYSGLGATSFVEWLFSLSDLAKRAFFSTLFITLLDAFFMSIIILITSIIIWVTQKVFMRFRHA